MSSGIELVGDVTSQFTIDAPKAVTNSGAVSPITLDTASSEPVNSPPKAEGNKILRITEVYDPPNARPASLSEAGNIFILSSVDLIIIGNIMMASATLPAIAE